MLLLLGLLYPLSLSLVVCERPLGVSVWLQLLLKWLVALVFLGIWSRKASVLLIVIIIQAKNLL